MTDDEMLSLPKVRYRIDNMDCPTEEQLIRQALNTMPEIKHLAFNLLARELTVYHRFSETTPITEKLRTIGMHAICLDQQQTPPSFTAGYQSSTEMATCPRGNNGFACRKFGMVLRG